MKTDKEIIQSIRAEIKEAGYTSRQVSVKNGILITVREASVNVDAIEKIAKKYESISRCEASGEILSGGNTYVNVSIDDEVKKEWAAPYADKIMAAVNRVTEDGIGEDVVEGYTIFRRRGFLFSITWWNEDGGGKTIGNEFDCHSAIITAGVAIHINNQKHKTI